MAGGGGDDSMLLKIAVFGIAMSIMSTCLVSLYLQGTSDYDYETIQNYRNDLSEYTGGLLTNDTPWILTGAYTPFKPELLTDPAEVQNHIDSDGWLYGESIQYSEIGKAADIRLDVNNKSNQKLSIGERSDFEFRNGKAWYNGGNDYGIVIHGGVEIANYYKRWANALFSTDFDTENTGYSMASVSANNWNYTGIRYTFDPSLPFKDSQASSKDGTLSIVWYDTGEDTGISGGLQIYSNGRTASLGDQVLLASYSAYDIIAAYQSEAGYAQTYDFDFQGVHLNLSIRFDPTVFTTHTSLLDAWNSGSWTMAISSVSAGNFFDVENSNAFSLTAGGVFDTFIQIFTFKTPKFDNDWVNVIMWLLVGLPFSVALLCVSTRVIGGVFKIF